MKKKTWTSIFLWTLAFILTVAIFVYQRLTGPTYPVKGQETFQGKEISYVLLRSFSEYKELPVIISAPDRDVAAYLDYKRYKTDDEWTEQEMTREGDTLKAQLPGQPTAGKVEYTVRVVIDNKNYILNRGKSVVARFKRDVPPVFLILHIIFMFFAIIFALRTLMEALRKSGNYAWLVNWTLAIVFVGGMILGPIVQHYAFGDLWTGFPFGFDLTDNKVLIAVICWVAAFFLKKKSKWWVVLAAAVMIIVYLIPHSVLGSELDYSTGKMKNKYSLNYPADSLNPSLFTTQMGDWPLAAYTPGHRV
jgi:hypothetical protein